MSSREQIREAVFEAFRRGARERAGRTLGALGEDTTFESLGLGSLTLFEIIGDVERGLSVTLGDDDLAELQTLGDLIDLCAKIASTGA